MRIDQKNEKHIIADEVEIYLGYSYYIGGVLQDPPHEDKVEDFEEIDKPQDEEVVAE